MYFIHGCDISYLIHLLKIIIFYWLPSLSEAYDKKVYLLYFFIKIYLFNSKTRIFKKNYYGIDVQNILKLWINIQWKSIKDWFLNQWWMIEYFNYDYLASSYLLFELNNKQNSLFGRGRIIQTELTWIILWHGW